MKPLAPLLLALCLATGPVAAAPPADGPIAGPLLVDVHTSGATNWNFLGLRVVDMEFLIENLNPEASLHVIVHDPVVTYADGSKQRLKKIYHGPFGEQVLLEPNSARIDFPLVVVPEDAPVGPAVIEFRAHVASIEAPAGAPRPDLRHSDWAPASHAVMHAGFDVLP